MNKNSQNRRRIALKNHNKGNSITTFEISITMPNSKSLGKRNYEISIGNHPRKSKNPKVARKNTFQNNSNLQ